MPEKLCADRRDGHFVTPLALGGVITVRSEWADEIVTVTLETTDALDSRWQLGFTSVARLTRRDEHVVRIADHRSVRARRDAADPCAPVRAVGVWEEAAECGGVTPADGYVMARRTIGSARRLAEAGFDVVVAPGSAVLLRHGDGRRVGTAGRQLGEVDSGRTRRRARTRPPRLVRRRTGAPARGAGVPVDRARARSHLDRTSAPPPVSTRSPNAHGRDALRRSLCVGGATAPQVPTDPRGVVRVHSGALGAAGAAHCRAWSQRTTAATRRWSAGSAGRSSLVKIERMCVSSVFAEQWISSAMAAFDRPCAM